MISADYLYKFRSKISKNIYNDLMSTTGDLINSINQDLLGKVCKIEFKMKESCIKILMNDNSTEKEFTDITNVVDSNLRSFIYLNKDKLDINSEEEKMMFDEFINGYSLYELSRIGKQIQFNL